MRNALFGVVILLLVRYALPVNPRGLKQCYKIACCPCIVFSLGCLIQPSRINYIDVFLSRFRYAVVIGTLSSFTFFWKHCLLFA